MAFFGQLKLVKEAKPVFAQLTIGRMRPRVPIIQGGMAVAVSGGRLAGAVAKAGGLGVVAGSGLTYEMLRNEIRKAREIAPGGYIGVNVLFAVRDFAGLMKTAMSELVDFVVSGAGFSRDMFEWGRDSGVAVIPIVSSARLAKLAQKLGAAAVVVEGKEAGGHLGTDRSIDDIVPEVAAVVDIPVIAAGGLTTGADIARLMAKGADGVQMATRFVLSQECEAHPNFKAKYLAAEPDDVVLIQSPVGLPGRALRNPFTERVAGEGTVPAKVCQHCLKHCSGKFCIMEALRRAVHGDIDAGLVFSGEHVWRIKDILPVQTIIDRLEAEYDAAMGLVPSHV